jgi:hypothetical protein
MGARVMMKVLHANLAHDERQRERFLHAKAVAQLLRDVDVRVLDKGMTLDGRPYLVTEWGGGETLENRMRREPAGHRHPRARVGTLGLRARSAPAVEGVDWRTPV